MFAIADGIKWVAILTIISILSFGVKWIYNKHLDTIDDAVNKALLIEAQERAEIVRNVTNTLRQQNEEEKKILEGQLAQSRAKVSDLQRMLLIDHDLDRLLQEKPGLILPRVNRGTEEAIKTLEELTQ
jgi:hypothetical protein